MQTIDQETQTINQPLAPAPQLPAVAEPVAKPPAKPARERKKPEGSIINIATAIAAITAEVGLVAKAGFNQFHRYKYATMQDVLQKLTPLIAKHGLVIVQTEIGRAMFDDDRAVAVEYEFTIAHTSGEMWPDRPKQTGLCRCRDSKGGFDDKALNKAHTAARKYFLLALFQIATGEEDDADQHQSDTRKPPTPAVNPMRPHPVAVPHVDPQAGEIMLNESGAVAAATKHAAAPNPPLGDTPPVLPAADPSPPTPGVPQSAASGGEAQRFKELDDLLAKAAENGMPELQTAWHNLTPPEQKLMKAALDRRHKPAAEAADRTLEEGLSG